MRGWVIGILFGCWISCTPTSPPDQWSPELTKVVLENVFFTGDQVQNTGGEWGVVLGRDSSMVRVLLAGKREKNFGPSELKKTQSLRIFRGAEPGMLLKWVSLTEPSRPRYQDALGHSYYYTLGEKTFFRVDYYIQPGIQPEQIQSIFTEVFMPEEGDAIRFYKEFASWLETSFGRPSGQLGDFSWVLNDRPFQLRLALTGQKKSITLSIDPKPAGGAES